AAVAGREQGAAQQRRADAVALPVVLDAERSLGLPAEGGSQRAHLGVTPQNSLGEVTVHHSTQTERRLNIVTDEIIGYTGAKTAVAAREVQAGKMVTGGGSVGGAQL